LDEGLADIAMDDYRQATLEPRLRLLLDFAVQVTNEVLTVDRARVAELREAGWTDAAILEAVEVIGFFNYYNRMADALGVESEPEWQDASEAGRD
jgi:uncharacterized peroxidase-related enzyme